MRVRLSAEQLAGLLAGGDEAIPAELAKHATDPVAFARDVLGVGLTSYQADFLRAIQANGRVAWRSGHKLGKSTAVAVAALWWVSTRLDARVVMIAPIFRQVRGILYRELRRLYRGAKVPLGGDLFDTPDRGLQYSDGREVIGFASETPERVAGFSGANMMFLLDEASGISEDIFAAISGNLAGGGKLALTGNPTRQSGSYFDAFHGKSRFYTTLHTSSLESPNFGDGPKVPGLATPEWAAEMLEEWGETSPLYQVRVLGNFSRNSDNAVISLEVVERARNAYDPKAFDQGGQLVIGLDPARMGSDESVAFARRGNHVLPPFVWRQLDSIQLAAQVSDLAVKLAHRGERPLVRVDEIGIGSGVLDQLRRNVFLRVEGVNVGESATVPTYARKRDEAWFMLRDWLRNGGSLPPDAKLEGELVAPTYSFLPSGKIQVESKDSMRARLKRSPDRADALALAVFEPRQAVARLPDDDGRRAEYRWPEERDPGAHWRW